MGYMPPVIIFIFLALEENSARFKAVMKKGISLLILSFFISGLTGCSSESVSAADSIRGFQGATMGTTYTVKYVPEKSSPATEKVKKAVDERLEKVNTLMSVWDPESEISRINKAPAGIWLPLHTDLAMLLEFAFQLSELTDGRYDVSIGPLIDLWGFGPGRAGDRKVPGEDEIARARQVSGYAALSLDVQAKKIKKQFQETRINLSSIAKGYGVDQAAEVLEGFGIQNYMIEIGGEIKTRGNKNGQPWKIAIESPRFVQNQPFNKILNLSDCAMATSGDYRNYFKEGDIRYSHAIDPETGRPVQNDLAGVTVAIPGGECFKADAWATAIMVSGREKGFQLAAEFEIPAHLIYIEGGELKEMSTERFIKEFL